MARYFLKTLKIEGFRGINNDGAPLEISFKSDAVNSIYAHNGAGKSSIFDALIFAASACLPKLDNLQAVDQPSHYYVNQFHSTGISTIALKFEPDDGGNDIDIVVQRDRAGRRRVTSPSGHAAPESFLSALGCELVFLDYAAFQAFINDSPLLRGRSFAALLGLARVSEMRQALEVLSHSGNVTRDFHLDELKRDRTANEQQLARVQSQVAVLFQSLFGLPQDQPFDPAAFRVKVLTELGSTALLKPLTVNKGLDEFDFAAAQTAVSTEEKGDLRAELTRIVTSLTSLRLLSVTDIDSENGEQTKLASLIESRDRELANTRGALFQQLFHTIEQIVDGEWADPYECPACGKTGESTLKSIAEARLKAYEAVSSLQSEIAANWRIAGWAKRLSDLEASSALNVPSAERQYGAISAKFAATQPSKEDLTIAISRLASLDVQCAELTRILADRGAELEKILPPSLVELTRKLEAASQLRPLLSEYETRTERLTTLNERIDARETWMQFITEASMIFKDAEVELSKCLTSEIEMEALRLYAAIMKTPEIVPKLKKSDNTENLELRLQSFYGQAGHSAAALLSESQRNALAISIYLSAAARSNGAARFLVLDDITSSFDSGHQWFLMDAIRNTIARPGNPPGPQVILLSHDGLLQKYFDRSDGTGWCHQRLQGCPPKGNVFTHAYAAPRLRIEAASFLANGETTKAEPLIRQYLELVLLNIIHSVGVPVPMDFAIKDHSRMVGNCLQAITGSINLTRSAGLLVLTAKQDRDLTAIHTPALIGNWVSHYETAASIALAPNVLVAVLDTADAFADCFRYHCTCGGTPRHRFYKSLQAKHCAC